MQCCTQSVITPSRNPSLQFVQARPVLQNALLHGLRDQRFPLRLGFQPLLWTDWDLGTGSSLSTSLRVGESLPQGTSSPLSGQPVFPPGLEGGLSWPSLQKKALCQWGLEVVLRERRAGDLESPESLSRAWPEVEFDWASNQDGSSPPLGP